ncbi:MAG: prepilin-type N-terminal cleavage/methylation domain-containing protein [Campylobacterota bacterium]|nr:prepilin-type N-terminal cleavage/methylation domain-containing protein [Campylobacterota bacterium]
MPKRSAFTLIEVLISIALLSLVLLALYKSVEMLRNSNIQLFTYLEKAKSEKKGTETLFLDILGSDGNLTIKGDEFSRLCIENTVNSLYDLSTAKVCWVIAKKENILIRSEGNGYRLPLNSDDRVAVDEVMKNIDVFRVYRQKGQVLVLLRQKGKESISFMVHGVPEIPKKKKVKKVKKKKKKPKKNKLPDKTKPGTPPGQKPANNVPGEESAPPGEASNLSQF